MTSHDINFIRIVDLTQSSNTKQAMHRPQIARGVMCCVLHRAYATGRSLVVAIILIVAVVAGSSTAASDRLWLTGINFAGAEFNSKRLPGKINKDYQYPKKRDINYFLDRGFTAFRLPFRWERLQLNLGWEFEAKELARLDNTVAYMTGNGAQVILDPHNYAHYFGNKIGSEQVPVSAFASFWSRLADHYKTNPRVIFGLMNEPHRIRADDWRKAVEAAIGAIRVTGARNLILVPGTSWSGAHSWGKTRDGVSNASVFRTLSDPADNMAFEVHQYFDSNYSGTSSECQSETIGVQTLKDFTHWLRENRHRGLLGEFGAADNAVCLEALDRILRYIADNSDVWIGWTYWAAGAWWGDYKFSVHPSPDGDKPQMKILTKHRNRP
jgi:endoglucanase